MPSPVTSASIRRAAVICSFMCTCLAVAGAGGRDRTSDRPVPPRRALGGAGTLVALPPVVQPGRSPAPRRLEPAGGVLRAGAARPPVLLQRDTRRGWRTVDSAPQDRSGSAAFDVAPGIYRARVARTDRAPAVGHDRPGARASPGGRPSRTPSRGTTLDASVWNDQERLHESFWAPRTCSRSDPAARRVVGGVLHLGITPDPSSPGGPAPTPTRPARARTTTSSTPRSPPSSRASSATGLRRPDQGPARTRHALGVLDAPAGPQVRGRRTRPPGPRSTSWSTSASASSGRDDHRLLHPLLRPGLGAGQAGRRSSRRHAGCSTRDEGGGTSSTSSRSSGRPSEYVFRVDGREYYRLPEAVSLAEHYLVLSMQAVDYELKHLTSDEFDDTAQVDWVRVYDATSRTSRPRRPGGRRADSFGSRLHVTPRRRWPPRVGGL